MRRRLRARHPRRRRRGAGDGVVRRRRNSAEARAHRLRKNRATHCGAAASGAELWLAGDGSRGYRVHYGSRRRRARGGRRCFLVAVRSEDAQVRDAVGQHCGLRSLGERRRDSTAVRRSRWWTGCSGGGAAVRDCGVGHAGESGRRRTEAERRGSAGRSGGRVEQMYREVWRIERALLRSICTA